MKLLERIEKEGEKEVLESFPKLDKEEFWDNFIQKNVFEFFGTTMEEIDSIEELPNCKWFLCKLINRVIPYECDWSISSDGIFDFD